MSATSRAATSADDPALTAWRLADAPMPIAIAPVSPITTSIDPGSTPMLSAQICASIVRVPCPIAVAPVIRLTRPDGATRTVTASNGPRPVPLT